jgi:hypothetical protein
MKVPRLLLIAAVGVVPFIADASDHNEPAPDAVWPAANALHQEWDISDLFGWIEDDRLNVIVAWHPQQLPLDEGQRADYSDQVLYTVHVQYERKGAQVLSDRYLEQTIDVRYGVNDKGEWGMLVQGLPGTPPVVLDCDSDLGWRGYDVAIGGGEVTDDSDAAIRIATGIWDDPFVFDVDGYNASLTRALAGEKGLRFDPKRDTFEGHNASAFVLSIPMEALEDNWEDFDPSGLLATEKLHIWVTTDVTKEAE